ncbi:RlpA-like double-psi beta-barrel-protein domain-containing protein-containing protein [Elsinoe ampelina]|uniref:RlpA-like double-psi beta-barrel-protein domain-containing protein-containing protein n=1 Tax=Elsinoe ampelina TaxID=302913 RepID=A0A6A6GEP3_9PEZI|nr:RlpA-like double-psi beta-barrel-protein domain-containing protein-containing protein [Elsinoe ampelina]
MYTLLTLTSLLSLTTAQTLKASFTQYGAGDTFGSPNCNTNTAACGFYTSPGYSAAASQNLFGVGPGAGAGPACGTCYRLTANTDSSGNRLSNAGNSIVVQVNNLCPAQGNPLCSQNGLSGTNQYGANVNFDLCTDSGAAKALFGNSGVGLAVGTAVKVSCSQWSGTVVH